ncbi:cytidylyltransferase domain-containing protein [Granulosicoccus antarcticus]|uniref:CMP-N,N'-diacetyllegionaminic acid synthase n=1 Tax=Granulosicoccus antarcticus IMCC3135 TaxID=1192854 RepID=A0A2Z2NT19_9GAMM|nr:acylneuraminate cytidylyltransferase family protein [Granulosicoccus antarcticus]ASJ74413.1 CMP-N,N'-diacetyllegionaminic acid synthase [Granulosicoccus antarcticus IMCC3135]
MIGTRKVLAVIPARGNSKGLPGKNVIPLAGKPLIAWSIDAALDSDCVDRVVVSTDSQEIADIAKRWGADVPFLRPAALAMDDTPGMAPLLHACQMVPGYDLVVLLQPTSPLRTAADVDKAIEQMIRQKADFCIGVTRAKHHPNWLFCLSEEGHLERYEEALMQTDRQSLSPVFAPNGAIYIANIAAMEEHKSMNGPRTVAYEMSAERSADIDTAMDLKICEVLMSNPGLATAA